MDELVAARKKMAQSDPHRQQSVINSTAMSRENIQSFAFLM
jgi:hypothetical protein